MGYKAGSGIGAGVAGRSTPIPLNLKAGRAGLGVEEQKRAAKHAARARQEERGTYLYRT